MGLVVSFFATHKAYQTKVVKNLNRLWGSELFNDDDEFLGIAKNYLSNKYKGCSLDGDGCRFLLGREEVEEMLVQILPPLSKAELADEVARTMKLFPAGDIEEDKAVDAFLQNTYWAAAGPLVVKELIFLDCVNSYYTQKITLLNDDDYNELKDMLAWEGSSAVGLTSDEARFIFAVAANRKGAPQLDDSQYEELKSRLQGTGSWVVKRALDPLERMGMNTFLGYLHREMAGKSVR
eukprot:CAMPEP_0182422978 /NCGR_PEP_ID=MMETSP1167-20130531/8858_1 /TAXON_ID=2988 /ORGANISM="Mallomonas Sp, Strain CCMP3275" /LENGTH=235 /DNA_ID=CAMNT_0024601523 /DNA_START=136 /DNA_END=843 /DNA_ORIENTATION=-